MAKYRKKPVEVEAWQWAGTSLLDAQSFCVENGLPNWHLGSRKGQTGLVIPTLEGDYIACSGDFVIRGVHGKYYPCKPDIFDKTYEKIT